jgi:hypothetical protein
MAGCDRPCRAQPADRSMVAEDRSAAGRRDRTGPVAWSVLVRSRPANNGRRCASAVTEHSNGRPLG